MDRPEYAFRSIIKKDQYVIAMTPVGGKWTLTITDKDRPDPETTRFDQLDDKWDFVKRAKERPDTRGP